MVVIFFSLMSSIGFGQNARLTGQVTDSSGASIPGASVTATNQATGIVSSTVTTTDGYFTLTDLPPSNYDVRAEKTGFNTTTWPGVTLNVAQDARLDFVLQVAGTVQEVTGTCEKMCFEERGVGTMVGEYVTFVGW